tara:strand:+ start:347 stop:538 length:192 start_codon:yes stop_codon:yes gene_type:complete
MDTIEEVMSNVNSVFGLKSNQNLSYDEKMSLLKNIIENDRNKAFARGHFNGKQELRKRIQAVL